MGCLAAKMKGMWVDSETEQDLVNFSGIAATVAQVILMPHMSPITIGIHGDWGYGKSSVLSMVRKQLKDKDGVLTLSFNGWVFEGFEDAKIALMDSVIGELANNRAVLEKAKDAIASLAKRINWFKVARKIASTAITLTTGVPDISDIFGAGGEHKDDDAWIKDVEEKAAFRHVLEFREAFKTALSKAAIKKLVVFVDDLDRCLPETAIGTLEAIRLFLAVENTVFVIGADEAMIEYSVRRHFPDLSATGGSHRFTKNYLEKLIQIPVRLPQLTSGETRRFITLLLVEDALREVEGAFDAIIDALKNADAEPWKQPDLGAVIEASLKHLGAADPVVERVRERIVLAKQIGAPLAERYVGNPRQVKRFLNTLMLRLAVATAYRLTDKVNMAALAKLMLLERQESEAYSVLSQAVAGAADGRISSLGDLEAAVRKDDESSAQAALEKLFGKHAPESILNWAGIDPEIGALDLRAYFFVSRERFTGFVSGAGMAADLADIVDAFAGAVRYRILALRPVLRELNVASQMSILEELIQRVQARGDYSSMPPEFAAIEELVTLSPALEDRMLVFLGGLPVGQVGIWVAAFVGLVARSQEAKAKAAELLSRWGEQTENQPLRQGVRAVAALAKKK